jgi:1,4-alpha-glucan branching enzyme
MRFADDASDFIVVACNFTPVPRNGYRVGVPEAGYYREILNSDSESYGGGNVGNGGGLHTDSYSVHGYENSLDLILPPLGIVMLKLERNHG